MVRSALPRAAAATSIDLLVIENVGNLVCPAEFRVGEDARVMVSSVTEGEDKPLKYPLMFRACELVLVNKIDLLPHLDFDLDRFLDNLDAVHPGVERMLVSARTGEGVDAWRDWLARARRPRPAPRDGAPSRPRRRSSAARGRARRFFDARGRAGSRALCHRMAERFARGGRLVALGARRAARSDVRHVAVEFVHPVIVGKRALPALGLAGEGGAAARRARRCSPSPTTSSIAFGEPATARRSAALALARARGCLTVAFAPLGAEWEFEPPSDDPFVRQELVETAYHVLWELVHVFFEHRGLLEGRERAPRPRHRRVELPLSVPRRAASTTSRRCSPTCAASVLMKAEEVGALREQTLADGARRARAAAAALRARASTPAGELLALGNGGSATDAMDVGRRLRAARRRSGWPARPALDLTEDTAILTAIANDIGVEAIFARQVIAYGRPGDALLALSTSGNSAQRARGARRGAPARPAHDRARRLRRRPRRRRGARRPRRRHAARSTSRASRRRRRAPTTCCGSWSSRSGR